MFCVLAYLFNRFNSKFVDFHFVATQFTFKSVGSFEPAKYTAFVGVLC